MIEFKSFSPGSPVSILDQSQGIVEAITAVTNIWDYVQDKILPGAFEETFRLRRPKVCLNHKMDLLIGKTLQAEELYPGDRRLPPNLQALGAGGVRAEMKFNLQSQRGADAFADVVFFGDEGEWSIGYDAMGPQSKSVRTAQGREIIKLQCYEFSTVPFGAAPHTVTLAVKDLHALRDVFADDLAEYADLRGITVDELLQQKSLVHRNLTVERLSARAESTHKKKMLPMSYRTPI
jgi:hypothetical protein